MSELPNGWAAVSLDEVCQIVRGITFPTTEKRFEPGNGLIACLRTANVQTTVHWDDLWFVPKQYVKSDEQLVSLNDILISTANSYELVGKVSRVTHTKYPSTLGAFISLLRSHRGVDAGFLYHQMSSESVQRCIREMSSTTTNISNVSGAKLKTLGMCLAPAAEQNRIVAKLEELLSDLDAGVAELKTAQKKLAQYRQSLLKAAVEGALTAEWRTQHTPQETGAQLLERILIERRARWEAKQLAKFKEQGKAPPKDWQMKYPEPVRPDTADLPELPTGWVWATIGQLAAIGTGVTPLKAKSPYYVGGDIPWITSGALNSEMIIEATEYVTPLALTECRLELYPAGALLVAMYGEGKTRGKCSELAIPATINQAIAALVLEDAAIVCKPYIKSFLLKSYDDMRNQASGGVQPNLNLQIVRSIAIPIPPIDEQRAITESLSVQLEAAKDQGTAIELSLKQSTAQRQNILRAAFSGQLVPQDPNDEPASVLLERIRAARAVRQATKKQRSVAGKETG